MDAVYRFEAVLGQANAIERKLDRSVMPPQSDWDVYGSLQTRLP